MMVHHFLVVEEAHEYHVVCDEGQVHKWLWERLVTHCVVVDPNQFIHVNLGFLDLFLCPGLSPKGSDEEFAVIVIADSKLGGIWCLFNFLALDITHVFSFTFSSDLLFECELICLKTVLLYPKFMIVFLSHCDCNRWIVGNAHRHDWVEGLDLRRPDQVWENAFVVFETSVWFLYLHFTVSCKNLNSWLSILRFITVIIRVNWVVVIIVLHSSVWETPFFFRVNHHICKFILGFITVKTVEYRLNLSCRFLLVHILFRLDQLNLIFSTIRAIRFRYCIFLLRLINLRNQRLYLHRVIINVLLIYKFFHILKMGIIINIILILVICFLVFFRHYF